VLDCSKDLTNILQKDSFFSVFYQIKPAFHITTQDIGSKIALLVNKRDNHFPLQGKIGKSTLVPVVMIFGAGYQVGACPYHE
jgi:hypothetical protein